MSFDFRVYIATGIDSFGIALTSLSQLFLQHYAFSSGTSHVRKAIVSVIMESKDYEVIEKRLHEVEIERATLLESLKTDKRDRRYSGKRLDLDKRVYPKTPDERVELFEKMFAARKDVFPQY